VIAEVDAALRAMIERAVNGSDVEVVFDAPTKEWSSRRNKPSVNVFLFDVREDLDRREVQYEEVRDEQRRLVARRPPPRRFRLSYLISAWTTRPDDEHRVLDAVIARLAAHDVLPEDTLTGIYEAQPYHLFIGLAQPSRENAMTTSDVWSRLGGDYRPALEVVVSAPLDSHEPDSLGPPVVTRNLDATEATTGGSDSSIGVTRYTRSRDLPAARRRSSRAKR
jgi:hypothetical protein